MQLGNFLSPIKKGKPLPLYYGTTTKFLHYPTVFSTVASSRTTTPNINKNPVMELAMKRYRVEGSQGVNIFFFREGSQGVNFFF